MLSIKIANGFFQMGCKDREINEIKKRVLKGIFKEKWNFKGYHEREKPAQKTFA